MYVAQNNRIETFTLRTLFCYMMFTHSERQGILQQLVQSLKDDNRIVGIVLVGSTAVGFADEYSDIDLIAVVDSQQSTERTFREWVSRLDSDLAPIHRFVASFDEHNFLAGFLLPGCLEIDFGVVNFDALIAKRGRWKVVYDTTGRIEEKLRSSWDKRPQENIHEAGRELASVWHYVIQTVISVQRKQLWRALHNLEEVRNRGLHLAGLRRGLVVSHFREIDQLPSEIKREFEQTLVHSVTAEEILRALRWATECFFRELQAIEREAIDSEQTAKRIAAAMNRLFDDITKT